jgi:hypothetical protein
MNPNEHNLTTDSCEVNRHIICLADIKPHDPATYDGSGPWKVNRKNYTLEYRPEHFRRHLRYWIPLKQIKTRNDILAWIMHVNGKTSFSLEDKAYLVETFQSLGLTSQTPEPINIREIFRQKRIGPNAGTGTNGGDFSTRMEN